MVTAVIPDGEGGVYIGVSVIDGRVLRARAPGEVELVGETSAMYVWALHRDESGKLWAATGVPGQILSRDEGEAWETVLSTGDDPVRCLASLPSGEIVAGTGLEARVIRIGEDGSPFVLFDGDRDEIVALATTDSGRIYALAAGPRKKAGPPAGASPRGNGGSTTVVRRRGAFGERPPAARAPDAPDASDAAGRCALPARSRGRVLEDLGELHRAPVCPGRRRAGLPHHRHGRARPDRAHGP